MATLIRHICFFKCFSFKTKFIYFNGHTIGFDLLTTLGVRRNQVTIDISLNGDTGLGEGGVLNLQECFICILFFFNTQEASIAR